MEKKDKNFIKGMSFVIFLITAAFIVAKYFT